MFNLIEIEREAALLANQIRNQQYKPSRSNDYYTKRFKSYKTAASNWVRNYIKSKNNRHDYLPLYFIWTTLRTCNFSCTYCDDHRGRKYPDLDNTGVLDTDQGKKLLKVMRTRTPAVYYAGGEPTLRNDLPELMREASTLGYFPQVINTNGSTFHKRLLQPSWRTFLNDIDIIVVSLDSLNHDTLSKMYKTSHPENVVRNIIALKHLADEFNFKLMINCVIQPDHLKDAHDVLEFANERDIYFCGVPENNGPRARDGLLENAEYKQFVEKLLVRHKQKKKFAGSFRLNERLYNGAPLSCRNTLKPHVDFDGRLFWPCKASVNKDPIMIDILKHSSVDEIWNEGNQQINATDFHGPKENQCGSQCNWAQNYTTDTYEYGLKHPLTLVREIFDFVRN